MTLCCPMLAGCGEDRTYEYDALTIKNRTIQTTMQEWYIWGENIKDQEWKDYFSEVSTFFSKLVKAAHPGDTWSYCLTDSLTQDCHERGTFNHINSYGIDYKTMSDPTRLTSQTYARILTVYDGSPAKECGLERGEFIGYIDGEKVTENNVVNLKNGDSHILTVSTLSTIGDSLIWKDERDVEIGASRRVADTQVPVINLFTVKGKVAGYVMINHLDNDSFKETIKEFKDADALIIDLRLCNTGTAEGANALASCLVGVDKYNSTFCTSVWNKTKESMNQTFKYDADYKTYNPEVNEVYFITSAYTAGAAEWVVYCLRHTMGTDSYKTVGVTSKGQNVYIMDFLSSYGYKLGLSVAYITDGDGNYDYASGISPDISINEFERVRLYPYGNKNEIVLSTIFKNL